MSLRMKTIAMLAASGLALAACSGGGGDEGSADGPIKFVTDKAAWEPSFDAMNAASESEGMELDFSGYADPVAYDSFVRQAFRTNERPDLFTWHTGGSLKELVEGDLVAETTELWTEAEEAGYVPEGLKDQFTFDGKQYCVPLNVAYWAVYYNKSLFEEHGVDVPETWDDMMAAATTFKEAGITPFHQMNIIFEFVWFQAQLIGQNPETYDGLLDGSASYLDEDVNIVMDQWQQLLEDGYFLDPGVTTDPQALLNNGEVAMAYYGTFFTGQMDAVGAVSGEDYGIFTVPNMNPDNTDKHMVLESGPLCVGAGSANEEAALEYSRWWMTPEAQTVWSEDRGDVSFNPEVEITDPELDALVSWVTDPEDPAVIHMRYLEGSPKPVYNLSTELFGEFVTNASDPRPIQEQLQQEADTFWESQSE